MISAIEKENGFKKGKLKEFLKENKTDISILEKQLRANIGWRQLVANKFRPKIVIQDSEVEAIHKKLESKTGRIDLCLNDFKTFHVVKKMALVQK